MKKRTIAFVLTIAMLLGVAPVTYAEVNPDYKMALVGTTEDFYESTRGITFDMQIKGPSVGNTASIIIKIDATKLEFVTPAAATNNIVAIGEQEGMVVLKHPAGYGNLHVSNPEWVNSVRFNGHADTSKKITYLSIQPEFGGTGLPTHADGLTSATSFRLAFKDGVTEDDLDMASVQVCTIAEIDALNQSEAAVITDGETVECNYNPSTRSGKEQTLEKPVITYTNSDVMNLNGVKLDADNRFVNVPVSLPEAGNDVTVATTATGYYASDCADGTEITSGVTYTYGLQIKDEGSDTARDLTDDEKAVLSVGTDGVVTIKAGAPQATLIVSANGSYTNTNSHTSTATGTYEMQLRHGDAGGQVGGETDPDKPDSKPIGGGDDVTKTASGVAIYEGDNMVTSSAVGTLAYAKTVAIPSTGTKTVTFVGRVVDQYGVVMTGEGNEGSWNSPTVSGVTFDNGAVIVDNTATADPDTQHNYTFSKGELSATVELTFDSTAITWPTLTNDTIIYGETADALTFDKNTGSVEGDGTITDVTFAWKADQALTAATDKAIMVCSFKVNDTAKTSEHEYDITVNKANLEIVINPDIKVEGSTIQLSKDSTIDLENDIKVVNADVQVNGENIEATDATATFALVDENSLVTYVENKSITGKTLSADGTQVATLTINADDTTTDDNYISAPSKVLNIKVIKPMLNATIAFDKTNPRYGDTVTATVTQGDGQDGSLCAKVQYAWGYDKASETEEGKTDFIVVESGNLTDGADTTRTLTHEITSSAEIGQTLKLQLNTPTSDDDYGWIHSVEKAMDNPVGKRISYVSGWGVKKTTTTITVDTVEGAKYAVKEAATAPTAEVEDPGDLTWQDSNVFTGLTPNTKYNVYVKKEATETDEASAIDMQEVTTDKISINDETDPASPKGGKVEINGNAFVGETLTAVITDPTLGEGETLQTIDVLSKGQIKWYRVDPTVTDNPETTDVVEGIEEVLPHTDDATKYDVVAEDTDMIIRVVVTANEDAPYSGSVQAETAKVVNGHSISGVVVSYNAKNEVTYELYKMKEDGTYDEPNKDAPTYTYHGIAVEAAETTTATQQTQNFTIEGIADGTYRLIIRKDAHVSYTINNVIVNGADLDLTQDSRDGAKKITMAAGELTSDGTITVADKNLVTNTANYGKTVDAAKDKIADINGDGSITVADKNIVTNANVYGKSEANYIVQ